MDYLINFIIFLIDFNYFSLKLSHLNSDNNFILNNLPNLCYFLAEINNNLILIVLFDKNFVFFLLISLKNYQICFQLKFLNFILIIIFLFTNLLKINTKFYKSKK